MTKKKYNKLKLTYLKKTVNVGIKEDQREKIIKKLKYGESINKFVQEAVDKKLKQTHN